MRTDLVEVHPRRLLVIAVFAVLGLAVAAPPPAPRVSPCAIEHGVAPLNDATARFAVIQGEIEQARSRHELARLERQLDELANSLEPTSDLDDMSIDVEDPSQEGQIRDGRLIRR